MMAHLLLRQAQGKMGRGLGRVGPWLLLRLSVPSDFAPPTRFAGHLPICACGKHGEDLAGMVPSFLALPVFAQHKRGGGIGAANDGGVLAEAEATARRSLGAQAARGAEFAGSAAVAAFAASAGWGEDPPSASAGGLGAGFLLCGREGCFRD